MFASSAKIPALSIVSHLIVNGGNYRGTKWRCVQQMGRVTL